MPSAPPRDADLNDSGLHCLVCNYNLTGLSQNQCPECGTWFNPGVLRRRFDDRLRPATPWDRDGGLKGFFATWYQSISNSRRMARRFPNRHSVPAAWTYSLGCYAIAAICLLAFSAFDVDAIQFGAVIVAVGVIAAIACEVFLAAALSVLIRPPDIRHPYHFWRGITHYTSGFLIVSSAIGGLAILLSFLRHPAGGDMGAILILFCGLPWFAAWWICLGTMIQARSKPGRRRQVAYFAIPFVGLLAMVIGVLVGVLFATTVYGSNAL